MQTEALAADYVVLAVSDTGCGMDENTQARIFEPFFTTKAEGQGTGLGLSTVSEIVKQSGGHVRVESKPQHGTNLRIYLPQVKEENKLPRVLPTVARTDRGSEVILLVEDEEIVRKLVRTVLAASGYTVLEARDGQEAIGLSQRCGGPIDLLITDQIMPGMRGEDLATILRRSRPGLKLLYISGYTYASSLLTERQKPDMDFLPKPFTPDALVSKVKNLLAPGQTPPAHVR